MYLLGLMRALEQYAHGQSLDSYGRRRLEQIHSAQLQYFDHVDVALLGELAPEFAVRLFPLTRSESTRFCLPSQQ